MKLSIWLISPQANAEIVKMVSAGEITRDSGRKVMDIMIERATRALFAPKGDA